MQRGWIIDEQLSAGIIWNDSFGQQIKAKRLLGWKMPWCLKMVDLMMKILIQSVCQTDEKAFKKENKEQGPRNLQLEIEYGAS